MEGCHVVKEHGDGDLTVECGAEAFVLTAEGEVYRRVEAMVAMVAEELLHSLPHMEGSPGIVVDEAAARTGPCRCVEWHPDRRLCWHKGVVGALDKEQARDLCQEVVAATSPALAERMRRWQESVDECKRELEPVPRERGQERLRTWIGCMSRGLTAKGVRQERRGVGAGPGNPDRLDPTDLDRIIFDDRSPMPARVSALLRRLEQEPWAEEQRWILLSAPTAVVQALRTSRKG